MPVPSNHALHKSKRTHEKRKNESKEQPVEAYIIMVGQSTLSDCDASLLHIQYSRADPQVSVPLPLDCPFYEEA
jgi:hypothetical protein